MNRRSQILRYIFSLMMVLAMSLPAGAAVMEDYCIVPPYVKKNLKPNILMVIDNSSRNAQPAFNEGVMDDTVSPAVEIPDPVTGLSQYDGTIDAPGLFQQDLWYAYDGSKFVPDIDGALEGNLLNWATTSMYDIITLVVVGGRSTSVQTNVNRLYGYSAGTWTGKIYHYWDESGVENVCLLRVEDNKLTISDAQDYLDIDLNIRCSLILEPPVRPAPEYRRIALTHELGEAYAAASSAGQAQDSIAVSGPMAQQGSSSAHDATAGAQLDDGWVLHSLFVAVNWVFDRVAEPAHALLKIDVPTKQANTFDVDLYQNFSLYAAASGESGFYVWSIAGTLPTGMVFNTTTAKLSGAPNDYLQLGQTFTVTLIVTDLFDPSKFETRDVIFNVVGVPLNIVQPSTADYQIHDALWFEPYTGYMPIAEGGDVPNYAWSATGLPPGMFINSTTGLIYGTPVPSTTLNTTSVWFVLTLTDTHLTVNVDVKIRMYGWGLRVTSHLTGTKLPEAFMTEEYAGFRLAAKGGSGQYTWYSGSLPEGLVIDTNTGIVSGVPTAAPGTYPVTFRVGDGISFAWSSTMYITVTRPDYLDLSITWPGFPLPGPPYQFGDIIVGASYPLPDGFRQVKAYGGDTANYDWSVNGLDQFGLAIEPTTGVIYTPDVNPDTGLPDPQFPGYVNSPEAVGYKYYTVSVSDGSATASVDLVSYITPYEEEETLTAMWPTTPGTLLPTGYLGKEYGGVSVVTWYGHGPTYCEVDPFTGSLPPGLVLNSYNCTISGEPTLVGSYPIGILVRDVSDILAAPVYAYGTIDVEDPTATFVFLSPKWKGLILPQAVVGKYYEFSPAVDGGTPPYTWNLNLPDGLQFDPDTGFVNGVPTSGGGYAYIGITVTDAKGEVIKTNAWVDIYPLASARFNNVFDGMILPDATEKEIYKGFVAVGVTGLEGAYEFYTEKPLPSGLSLDPDTGKLSGTPSLGTAGVYDNIYICIKDAAADKYVQYGGTCKLVSLTINKAAATPVSKDYDIIICAGDYVDNCVSNTVNPVKHGLLQDYWDQARFGALTFVEASNKVTPGILECIPENNQSTFFSAVQTAVPVDGITKLVDAEKMGVTLFINSSDADNSCPDVFKDDNSPCRNNFILMLTSGEGADNPPNPSGGTPDLFTDTTYGFLNVPASCREPGMSNLAVNACYGFDQDVRPGTDYAGNTVTDPPPIDGSQRVSTYIVHTMGIKADLLAGAAEKSGGLYYYAENARQVKSKLEQALKDIIKKATSGTAASVLASGEGSGANIIQAIYYPRKRFRDSQARGWDEIMWIGKLSGFWYYADPYYTFSDIREETQYTDPPSLNIRYDYIVQPFFNATTEKVEAALWEDADADGGVTNTTVDNFIGLKPFEDVNALWEAGKMLWDRDVDEDPRTIYVNINDAKGVTMPLFTNSLVSSNATIREYMQRPEISNAVMVADFVNGYEVTGVVDGETVRTRAVKVDLNKDDDTLDPGEDERRVWKLGDVLNSSPVITATKMPVNAYDSDYCDSTYSQWVDTSETYRKRGMAYAGGNDGMLHAFKLGYLKQSQGEIKAYLYNSPDYVMDPNEAPFGYEKWAFIPKHALPYLKYQLRQDYCHIFTVDQTVTIVDASLCESTMSELDPDGNTAVAALCSGTPDSKKGIDSWRSVLIGGMRYGGACKAADFVCTTGNTIDMDGDGVVDDNDCVKAPIQSASGEDIGMSSYFALDISDEDNPTLMWEFTHPALGFSTSGPTIVRFNVPDGDRSTIGQWYALFGSGPTGPIDKKYNQFVGASDQSVKIFVVDLKTGLAPPTLVSGYVEPNPPISNAFITTMGKASNDFNHILDGGCEAYGNYASDVIYVGYSNKCDGSPIVTGEPCPVQTWRDGGILRVLTGEKPDPNLWNVRPLIQNIGPIYAGLGRVWDTKAGNETVWVYAGTGRYFYERKEPWTGFDNAVADDQYSLRHILAIKDPCAQLSSEAPFGNTADALACTDMADYNSLRDVTYLPDNTDESGGGWRLTLDAPIEIVDPETSKKTFYGAERVITSIKVSEGMEMLNVTSFKPYTDECSIGGETYLWALHLSTGGALNTASLKGVAIMQVSTGNIKKIDLSQDFTTSDGRKTTGEVGVTSVDPPKFSSTTAGTPRLLHILERPQ